jgi:hypothetical protein
MAGKRHRLEKGSSPLCLRCISEPCVPSVHMSPVDGQLIYSFFHKQCQNNLVHIALCICTRHFYRTDTSGRKGWVKGCPTS